MNLTDQTVSRIKKYRWPIIFGYLFLLALCIPGVLRLEVTVEMDDYFLDDDPVLSAGRDFGTVFDNGEFIGVLLESDDVYSTESLELIHDIGLRLESSVPDGIGILSLAVLDGRLTGGRHLEFSSGKLASSPGEVDAFRDAVSDSPLLGNTLVSENHDEAWIILSLEADAGGGDEIVVGRTAWKALADLDTGDSRISMSGVPLVAFRKYAELMEDLIRVIIIAAVVAVLLSLAILRSVKGVLGTLGVFLGSVVIVLGVQGWSGAVLDSGFLGVPILLTMGISIGYTVHIHRYYRISMAGGDVPANAAAIALIRTARPIFFTAVTTIASLLSFLFVSIRPIRWVGYTSAFSVFLAFLLSVLLFPVVMSLGKESGRREEKLGAGVPERFFDWIARVVSERKIPVIFAFVLFTVLAVIGLSRLVVDFDAVEMMGTRLPHMREQIHVGESEIAVGEFMNLMVSMPEGHFQTAEGLRAVADLEERINGIDGVRRVTTVTIVLGEVNSLMHRRNPEYSGLPDNDNSLEALMRFLGGVLPDQQGSWVDESGSHARIFIEISDFSSKKIEGIIEQVRGEVDAVFSPGTRSLVCGSTYQVAMMNQYITRGLVWSVGTALAVISLIMVLVFRSLRWGLVAMIPNVFPVLVAGGILGFAGIPLEFVTMTVAPIILGLAVDDTIHFMGGLRAGLGNGRPFRTVLVDNLMSIGTAISQTTFILCMAFLIFTFSRVNSIRNMGIIASAGMLAAYLADLLLVPVLAGFLGRKPSASQIGEKRKVEGTRGS